MADITQGIDSYFNLSVLTLLCGGFTLLIRFAYKSKCKSVELCCLRVDRDINTELKEDLQNPTTPSGRTSSE